jgi:hypothetical protein
MNDSLTLAQAGAATLGLILLVAGLYVQRDGRLRTRQGAAVLASFASVVGLVVTVSAASAFILATRG